MKSSMKTPHVCFVNQSLDTHHPSSTDLYKRMVTEEREMVENHRREKSQSLARRGWAKIKPAMAKWKEERKEEREAHHLSQASLTSPFARRTRRLSISHFLDSSSTLVAASSTDRESRIEAYSIISHDSLSNPAKADTSLAIVAKSSPSPSSPDSHRRLRSCLSSSSTLCQQNAESAMTAAESAPGMTQILLRLPRSQSQARRRRRGRASAEPAWTTAMRSSSSSHPRAGERKV